MSATTENTESLEEALGVNPGTRRGIIETCYQRLSSSQGSSGVNEDAQAIQEKLEQWQLSFKNETPEKQATLNFEDGATKDQMGTGQAGKKETDDLRASLIKLMGQIKITPETEEEITIALVGAWAFLEDPIKLEQMLNAPAFTHSSRTRDARITTGCIATPNPTMKQWLLPADTESMDSKYGRLAFVMANGATDNTRAARVMSAQSGWIAPIKTEAKAGDLEYTTIQSLIRKVELKGAANKEYPHDERIKKVIFHLKKALPENNRSAHRFDKVSISPDGQRYILAAPAYQPILLRHALLSVGQKTAQAYEKTLIEQATTKNKEKPEISTPKSARVQGTLFAYQIGKPQNAGNTLFRLNGETIVPVVTPPPAKAASSATRNWGYAYQIAQAIAETPDNESEKQIAIRRTTETLTGKALKDACWAASAPIKNAIRKMLAEEKHGSQTLNASHKMALEAEGESVYSQFAMIVEHAFDSSPKAPPAQCFAKLKGGDRNAETELPEDRAGLLESMKVQALDADALESIVSVHLNPILEKHGLPFSLMAESIASIKKGLKREALTRKNELAGGMAYDHASQKPKHEGQIIQVRNRESVIAQAIGLKIRVLTENCTLDGGLTAGMPSLIAQHGFLYNNLTLKSGLEFTRSLMVLHSITPDAPRKTLRSTIPIFKNSESGEWDSIGTSDKFIPRYMPFLQGQDKPGDSEPRQVTFTANMETTFLVEIPTQTLTQRQAHQIASVIAGARLSGGNISRVSIEIVAQQKVDPSTGAKAAGWTLPSGYLIKKIDMNAIPDAHKNLIEKMFAHNLFFKGRRVSDILPDLKVPGVDGAFGFTLTGLAPISDKEALCYRQGKPQKALWAEPLLYPVELKHSRHFKQSSGDQARLEWPWVEPVPKSEMHDMYYLN